REWLVVEHDLARSDELTQRYVFRRDRSRHELDRNDAVVGALAEPTQSLTDIGGRCRMVTTGAGPSASYDRKLGAPRGANPARVASEALRHLYCRLSERRSRMPRIITCEYDRGRDGDDGDVIRGAEVAHDAGAAGLNEGVGEIDEADDAHSPCERDAEPRARPKRGDGCKR